MIRYVAIAGIAALSAMGAARAVAGLDDLRQPSPVVAAQAVQLYGAPPVSSAAQVVKAADGHYWAQAAVNGKAVRFLVDTGATAVSLTTDDARRLGLNPAELDYRYEVITADGRTRAAAVKLASVSISGARVDNVDALVIERGLSASLLGMSYLGRLRSFEATRTAMILRP